MSAKMIAAQQVVERVLAASQAEDVVVLVSDGSEASLRWAGNSMTTNGLSSGRTWTVVSFFGPRVGSVSSTSVDPDDIEAVVRASEAAARAAEPAADAMALLDGGADGDWEAPAEATDIDVFAGVAADLARGFDGADQLYGFAHHTLSTMWLGASTGTRRRFVQPTGSIEINAKRAGASGWAGAGTTDFTDVRTDALLAELNTRLAWAAKKIELPAGRYETLLPPSAVADLMIYLMWTMEGRPAAEGHTALSRPGGTRVGERLTELPLTLYSDPAAPGLQTPTFVATGGSSDSVSVFDNGMAIERVDWVRAGEVNALQYPRAAAQEFGAPVAAPGANLLMSGGTDVTLDEMVADTERGLLLTCLWYIREVDPATLLLTGLTRDGVYLVEDGRVTGEVNNFRFNESPLDLLRRVTEAGAGERTLPREWKDWFTRTAMPPLRIPDFHMSSVSQAT